MKRRSDGLTLLALLALAIPGEPARAQEAAPQQLQKVEIVGSHLKRVDGEGPVPVSTYTRDDIEASGAARLGDFLLALPFAGAGGSDDRSTTFSPGFEGTAALSLRGLGPGATLVLLNGRRLAAYGLALFENDETFVDLNSLPLAAVERIEILRDGASAIYGADAIGGVVNIVLRRDFSGAEVTGRIGQSTRGDARRRYATASFGAGDLGLDRYNAFITIDAHKQDAVPMAARPFSRSADQRPRGGFDGRFPTSSPPTIVLPGGDPFAARDCPPDRVMPAHFLSGRGTACGFDPNLYNPLLPQVERLGALAVGSAAPSADLRLYTEIAVNRLVATKRLSPAPVMALVPADAPTNPFGQDAFVLWRSLDAGGRQGETTIRFRRAVAGAQGAWQRWEWDLAAGSTAIDTEAHGGNELRRSAVLESLRTGALNPFVANNDPAALAAVKAEFTDRFAGRSGFVLVKGTTELTPLEHGPLALAIGAERRRESFATALDALNLAGEINGVSQADSAASRTVRALWAEVNWPAAAGVEVQLAARQDRYSDFGSNTSPKVALRWQPAKALLLRASTGRGFLPPSLAQLNRPRTASEGVFDPVRCPVTGSFGDCGGTGIYSQQGNPRLDAERAREHNVGIVVEPVAGWSASLDLWRIAHVGKIVFGGDYILRNEAAFPGRVIRGPAAPGDPPGLPGPIVEFRDAYINIANRDVRGVDLELKGRMASVFGGSLALGAMVSYLDRFVERVTPLDPAGDLAGGDGRPRLRANASAEWQRGAWQFGLAARHIRSYRYLQPIDDAPLTVASWTVFDLSVAWRGPRDRISLTLFNAADRDPPFRSIGVGYDYQAMHEPLGRFVSLAWRHSF